MNQLWAPWRGEYVTNPSGDTPGCFLCAAAAIAGRDGDSGIVHCAPHSLMILNRYPYSSGHVMVAPKVHVGEIDQLDDEAYACVMRSVRLAIRVLKRVYAPHGFNVGINMGAAAGAGVPDHCHVHVVPRWQGDTNFMPVIGQAKVLSESLGVTWQRIVDELVALESTP